MEVISWHTDCNHYPHSRMQMHALYLAKSGQFEGDVRMSCTRITKRSWGVAVGTLLLGLPNLARSDDAQPSTTNHNAATARDALPPSDGRDAGVNVNRGGVNVNSDPAGRGRGVDVNVSPQGGVNIRDNRTSDNQWRYRRHNNEWWYWTPQSSWVYHRGGRWNRYDSANFRPYSPYRTGYRDPYFDSRGRRAPVRTRTADPAVNQRRDARIEVRREAIRNSDVNVQTGGNQPADVNVHTD
jgi:hypothetical protein